MNTEYWDIVILQPAWIRYGICTTLSLCLTIFFFFFYIIPLQYEHLSYQKKLDDSHRLLTNINNVIRSYPTQQTLIQHKQAIIDQLKPHNLSPDSIFIETSEISQKIIASGCQLNKLRPIVKHVQSVFILSHWQLSLSATYSQFFQLISNLSHTQKNIVIESLTITNQKSHLNIEIELALYQIDKAML